MGFIVEEKGGIFEACPSGMHLSRCYRIVDLGTQKSEYLGQVKYLHKIMLGWEIHTTKDDGTPLRMRDGRPFAMFKNYTLSWSEKANLRLDLQSWRGKPFTQEEMRRFDLETILGAWCLLNVIERPNKDGKTYVNIDTVTPVPQMMKKSGLPEGVMTVVTGEGETVGKALVDQADYVCFTGSTETGRIIAQQVGERLINASLELGGKNPMIVCKDADIERFVDVALSSCFTSAGQLCVSTERIYIDREIFEQFKNAFVTRVKEISLGSHLGWGYDMGSITSKEQLERIDAAVKQARSEGAVIECGGRVRTDIGPLVYEPTVLTHVNRTMEIARKEVFGPVVYLSPFDTIEEAIKMSNDTGFGLSGSIITSNKKVAYDIAAEMNCGSVNINEGFAATFGSVEAPMGGMGQSGSGRRQGPEGLLRFTEAQTVSLQRGALVSRKFGSNDKRWGRTMVLKLRLMRLLHLR